MARIVSRSCLVLAFFSCGCDQSEKKPVTVTRERSQVVESTAAAAPAPAPTPSPSALAPAAQKPPRKLCEGQLAKPGRAFPKDKISRAAAPGERERPANLAPTGAWTWVNFWAAWCVPCREEMPRLKGWEQKLKSSGKAFALEFVTLDDDARQLEKFLAAQPPEGVRTSYWLKDGEEREKWMKSAGLEVDPELPSHLLVDPKGRIRCAFQGAVEDRDFPQLAALIE